MHRGLYVYDMATEERLGKLDGSGKAKSVAVFEKGADERSGMIAVGYENGTIMVWGALCIFLLQHITPRPYNPLPPSQTPHPWL